MISASTSYGLGNEGHVLSRWHCIGIVWLDFSPRDHPHITSAAGGGHSKEDEVREVA